MSDHKSQSNDHAELSIDRATLEAIAYRLKHAAGLYRDNDDETAAEQCMKYADELLTEPCFWRYDVDGFYSTSCFNAWHFESGNVGDNRVKYCPFCGRTVEALYD